MDLKIVFGLLELAGKVTVGPLGMPHIDDHTKKNAAGFAALAFLLTLSISVFSGGINISLLGAGLLSVITSCVVAIIGLFANLIMPLPTSPAGEPSHEKNTNKFVTYAILSFLMTVLTFVIIGILFLIFGKNVTSMIDLLTVDYLWRYDRATVAISTLCALIGTGLLYLFLHISKRLFAYGVELAAYIASTVVICSSVFYMSHFVFFG